MSLSRIPALWRLACVFLVCVMAAILLLGSKGIGEINTVPTWIHKVEHFLYYGAMAALLAVATGPRRLWIAFVVVAIVGGVDEWHQLSVPGRSGSPLDWLVDIAGAAVALMGYFRLVRRRDPAMAD